jgi:hypothetical protein
MSAAAIAVVIAGCCTSAPPAVRYFDRLEPFDTVNAFVYAIDSAQYDFAYDCLTEESRKLFTRSTFKFALRFNVDVPEVKIPIRDLIVGAERHRFDQERIDLRNQIVFLWYRFPNGNQLMPSIYLVRESEAAMEAAGRKEPMWFIDLDRTFRELAGTDLSKLSGAEK